jgi:hypothetical protein
LQPEDGGTITDGVGATAGQAEPPGRPRTPSGGSDRPGPSPYGGPSGRYGFRSIPGPGRPRGVLGSRSPFRDRASLQRQRHYRVARGIRRRGVGQSGQRPGSLSLARVTPGHTSCCGVLVGLEVSEAIGVVPWFTRFSSCPRHSGPEPPITKSFQESASCREDLELRVIFSLSAGQSS